MGIEGEVSTSNEVGARFDNGFKRAHDDVMVASRVLVIDDEPGIRLLLERVFSRAGFEITVAATLGEAERFMPDVDLVFTDYHLGQGITGCDVATTVGGLSGRSAPPVILLTATPDDVPPEKRALFADIVAKPFQLAALVDEARVVLAGRRPRARSRVEDCSCPDGASRTKATDD